LRLLAATFITPGAAGLSQEQNLVKNLSRFGSVLAIGRPGEGEPPPGALRFYVTDAHWQEKVQALLPLCQIVIWTSGQTAGLRWEADYLIKTMPPRRLLLWVHVQLGQSRKQRDAEWGKFLGLYNGVFPKPLPQQIRNVKFIAFDDDWTPRPLARRGLRPLLRARLR
jgi:hypothetical protein